MPRIKIFWASPCWFFSRCG